MTNILKQNPIIVTGDESWVYLDNEINSRLYPKGKKSKINIVRKNISSKKIMITVFFDRNGIVLIDFLGQNKKMNGKYFIDHILKKLEKKVKEKYGNEKVYLHYDNSPIHKCNIVQKFISKHKLKILNHPPYSPDLAPSDFSLFGILKTKPKGKPIKNENMLKENIIKILNEIEKKNF
jgi:histone-lysine N-methyltransferase SETMAR